MAQKGPYLIDVDEASDTAKVFTCETNFNEGAGNGKCLKSEALGTPCKEAGRHCQGSVAATADNDYSFCVESKLWLSGT